MFTLSSQIPGTIHAIDAVIPERGKGDAAQGKGVPLFEEVLSLVRAEAGESKTNE